MAKHTCALSTAPPLLWVSARRGSELRAPAVSKTVILSVNASLTHGGLCQPLQLYFVLNEWVIRRPLLHLAPTRSGPHRERTVGCLKVDIHWASVALLCKTTVLFVENYVTITRELNMGCRLVWKAKNKKKNKKKHSQCFYWVFTLFLVFLAVLPPPVNDLPGCGCLVQEGHFVLVCLISLMVAIWVFPRDDISTAVPHLISEGGINQDHPWMKGAHISELWCWALAN